MADLVTVLENKLSFIQANPAGNSISRSGHRRYTPEQVAMIAAIKKQIRMLKRESKIKRGVEQLIEAGGKPYDDPIVATLHDVLADIIIRQKIALENTLFTSEKRDEYLKLVKEEELINLKIQKELSRVLKEHTANASVAAIVGLPPDEETELDGDMTDLMDMITRMSGGARRRTRRHRKTQRRH